MRSVTASAVHSSGAPSWRFDLIISRSRIRALCSGTHPGRLQDGAANGTSAGASTLDLPGKLQAQCGASLPPHNLSCTQAIAVVRPFAVRSRRR